jgi:5-methyltetrahydropteroyltriglutamate--homocysteine methyltransferase
MLIKPPFRADQVGSLLRPPELLLARSKHSRGEISASELASLEDRAIERIIAREESIGLRAVTDGEFRRANWAFDFLIGLKGTEAVLRDTAPAASGPAATASASPRMQLARVAGKLHFAGHPMIDHFRFLAAHTTALGKMTLPSPTMIISASRNWRDVVDRKAYPDIEELYQDLGEAYAAALRAFHQAGCRYLQLDDVNMAYLCDPVMRAKLKERGDDPESMFEAWTGILSHALAGRPADLVVTTHVCRGNFRSSWFAQGGYEAIAETLFNHLDYDGYFLEYDSERAGGFEPLRFVPKGAKKVVLGLVTTKSGVLEDSDLILRRIEAAARYVDLSQLCLSPQCGFASTEEGNLLTEEEQWSKLALIVEIARKVWTDA